jgi:NitT/TauT family transport system substrate-binding protein
MTKRNASAVFALAVFVLLAAAGLMVMGKRPSPPASIKLTLATTPSVYSSLIVVADAKGFFKDAGIDVTLQEYQSDSITMEKLASGEVQMATASDLAFMIQALHVPALGIVASIASADTVVVMARKDRRILAPFDLKGKKIGVGLKTTGPYYLSSFFLVNAIPQTSVTLVDISPDKLADALADGMVDAILTRDAYAFEAKKRLGDLAVTWSAQNRQEFYWVLAVKNPASSKETVKRTLTALKKAEDFILLHEDEARGIVMNRWGYDARFMRQAWYMTKPRLTLDQALVISLEDGAAWKLDAGARQAGAMPDILDYISTSALDEVDPKAVTILR